MKIILLLLLPLFTSCAYRGDVYLYSPSGADNIIEKAVDAAIDVPLLP
jgi:accessory colonization factor AcfC